MATTTHWKRHGLCCAYAVLVALSPAFGQVLSWSAHMPATDEDAMVHRGLALVDPEQVRCLTGESEAIVQWYDWQGAATNTETLERGQYLHNTDEGNVLVGTFPHSMSMAGVDVEGGTAEYDLFLAGFDQANELQYLKHSVTFGTQCCGIWSSAVSPSGRTVLFLWRGGNMTWGNDTILGSFEEHTLLSFDASGDLEWYRTIHGTSYSLAMSPEGEDLAVDDEGNVWLAGRMHDSMVFGSDTLAKLGQVGSYEHFVVHLAPDGDLEASILFPELGASCEMSCKGLQPNADGGIAWIGSIGLQALIGDSLLTNTDRKGLLMQLDASLGVVSLLTVNGPGGTALTAIAHDPNTDGLVLAGYCPGSAEFGGSTLNAPDEANVFVTTMAADGTVGPLLRVAGCTPDIGGTRFASLTDILMTSNAIHVLGVVGAQTHVWNGTTVGRSRLLTRIDRNDAVSIGAEYTENAELICWPSPAREELHVRIEGDTGGMDYSIFAETGAMVRTGRWMATRGNGDHIVPIAGLASGLYSITITGATMRAVRRFAVE